MNSLLKQGAIASDAGVFRQWLESLSDEDRQALRSEVAVVSERAARDITAKLADFRAIGESVASGIASALQSTSLPRLPPTGPTSA